MPSSKDQLRSYRFAVQRVTAAVVLHQIDPGPSPWRRLAGASLASVLVTAATLAAVAGYALLRPGFGGEWRDGAGVIVERESGARYVYLDGRLHPVPNYSSALLILNAPAPVRSVSRDALAGVPRGVPMGIAGAPDSLPAPRRMLAGGWALCSAPRTTGGQSRAGSAAGPGATSTLLVGTAPSGGRPVTDAALLVTVPDGPAAAGTTWLLWHGYRHLVVAPETALAALGWAGRPPEPVAPALPAALPRGPDLARPSITGRGRLAWSGGPRVGTVFVVETAGGERMYAVARRGGLDTISQVEADLLLGDPLTAAVLRQREAVALSPAEFVLAPKIAAPAGAAAPAQGESSLPRTTPRLDRAEPGRALCALFDGGAAPRLRLDLAADALTAAQPGRAASDGAGEGDRAGDVDRVVVAPGHGAVVSPVPVPGQPSAGPFLVTDLGIRYAVAGADALAALGYAGVPSVSLPAAVLALLPSGPVLDPRAARAQIG